MSNVGKIMYDKDAMYSSLWSIDYRYIHLPSLHFTDEKSDLVQQHTVDMQQTASDQPCRFVFLLWYIVSEGVQMVRDLQQLQDDIEAKLRYKI